MYTYACISIIHIWRIFSTIKRPFPWMATMAGGGQLWHGLCVPGSVRDGMVEAKMGPKISPMDPKDPEEFSYVRNIPMIFPSYSH